LTSLMPFGVSLDLIDWHVSAAKAVTISSTALK
jgi:hypothetical protein